MMLPFCVRLKSGLGLCSTLALLANPPGAFSQSGSLDPSFNPGAGVGTNESCFALTRQIDGGIIIAGDFTTVGGVPRNRIARLANNGALDSSFNPGAGADDLVTAVALQGSAIVIGGYFTEFDGTPRNYIARLASNGTLDTSFDPGTGADGPVFTVLSQSDGKVLLGGEFTSIDDAPRVNIARLNGTGSVDFSFDPGAGVGGASLSSVKAMALQTDGKVLIGGTFTSVDGTSRTNIARLNANGSLDGGFAPVVSVVGAGILSGVNTLAVQSDGKIVIGGDFTGVNGLARTNIARLNTNGTLDVSFSPTNGPNLAINSLAVQSNGKIVIGGYFTQVNGVARNYIARLNNDGSLDLSFDPQSGADDATYATVLQDDGRLLIGGIFTTLNGTPRRGIARLFAEAVTPSPTLFNPLRTGTTFQVSVLTITNKTYTLEYKTAVTNGWTSLPGVAGNGSVRVLTNSPASDPQRLYRVRVD